MQKISNDMEQATLRNSHSVATDAIKNAHETTVANVLNFKRVNLNNVVVVKKDGTKEKYNVEKVVAAIKKSAARTLIEFSDKQIKDICTFVNKSVLDMDKDSVAILQMHNIVESALQEFSPLVAESYRNYRNYKTDFVSMLDKVYQESQRIMYIGDKENANADSTLVSTKRSLIFNELNKELYKKFFLTVDDKQAIKEGYIYIHDMCARRDTMNCCLFDMANVLKGGFEMGNLWYNEPKTLAVAFDVIGDVVLSTASQQYGGFTVPEIDKILEPYAIKSYEKYRSEMLDYVEHVKGGKPDEKDIEYAEETAKKRVKRDFEQGFQGLEYKLNSVGSSRGDYPFITITLGLGTSEFEKMASISALRTRQGGQGKKTCKKPVLFPKIVFLYDMTHPLFLLRLALIYQMYF